MYLVLQARTDQSGIHEYKCIYEATDLKYNQLLQINFASDFIDQKELLRLCKKAKGIIIGGLGEVGYGKATKKEKAWFNKIRRKILPVLKKIIDEKDTKVLGICFGHQLLAEVLGAKVLPDVKQTEIGLRTINLTNEGKNDPLFKNYKKTFSAIEGHRDSVMSLPKNTTHLASSQACNIQAFRYKKYIYGVQFHPELTYKDLKYRATLYPKYSENNNDSPSNLSDSEGDSRQIIKNFINL